MKADYTEVWISSALVPLIQFADYVRPLSSTQLDLVGLNEPAIPSALAARLCEFDEIVSWYGANRPEFRALFPNWQFLQALPGTDVQEHVTDFFLRQVGAPRGLASKIDIELSEPRDTVVIHPFSGSTSKNWPLDRYQQFAKELSAPVEWIAGPEEQLLDATRFNSLLDLARWMSGASVYIGNDSGISHLAAAIGLPSLVLFGPTDPQLWAPRGSHITILRHQTLGILPVGTVFSKLLTKAAAMPMIL